MIEKTGRIFNFNVKKGMLTISIIGDGYDEPKIQISCDTDNKEFIDSIIDSVGNVVKLKIDKGEVIGIEKLEYYIPSFEITDNV